MARILALLLCACSSLSAVEPDWNKWNAYALDLLQRYIRIASVDPPADTRATAELIRGEFEKRGFPVTVYPSGSIGQTNLVIRLKGRDSSRKPLLLSNHMDVVPVDRAAWKMDPFGAEVRDGFIWGRGALDMKGVGVEQMVALMALKEAGLVPARDIVMLCTADEEAGGVYGIQWMIKNHFSEIDAEYVLDEGGLGSREALAKGKTDLWRFGGREATALDEADRKRNGRSRVTTDSRECECHPAAGAGTSAGFTTVDQDERDGDRDAEAVWEAG